MMKSLFVVLALGLAACGGKKEPAPAAVTPPAATEPAAAGSANGSAAATGSAAGKCMQSGGHCSNKLTMEACPKFEEGPEWGCGDNEGCCMK